MSRNSYIFIITLLFSITYLPEIPSIIFHKQILINYIPRATIKSILFFLICIMESSFIKKQYPGIFGWILSFTLLIGFSMLIMHSSWSKEIIIVGTFLILINLVYHAHIEKNKNIFNYLLFGFIVIKVFMTLAPFYSRYWRTTPYYEFIWWLDIFMGILISFLGIKYCYRLITIQK